MAHMRGKQTATRKGRVEVKCWCGKGERRPVLGTQDTLDTPESSAKIYESRGSRFHHIKGQRNTILNGPNFLSPVPKKDIWHSKTAF